MSKPKEYIATEKFANLRKVRNNNKKSGINVDAGFFCMAEQEGFVAFPQSGNQGVAAVQPAASNGPPDYCI